jgi:predicted metalloprotease with PDZ domain
MRRGRGNGGSGAGGSFLMNTPSKDLNLPPQNIPALQAFLAHEMLHQFPEQFDDANVGEPTHWWSEGVATFYSNVLAYRLGLKTLDEFAADWNGFIARYYSDPNRLLSYKEMMDGMFGPVGLNIMYGKGQVFMMVLNTMIKEKSGGTRSLDDLVFPLVRQHRRGGSYTRADFLHALERELGAQGRAAYEDFRAGGKLYEIPANAMGPCFRREAVEHKTFVLGFDAAAATTGDKRVIKTLLRGSPAERAGVREGDEVLTTLQVNALRADTSATLTLELSRNGTPVTATFAPRVALNGFRFVRDSSVAAERCKI